jgi:hypothetical protein
MMLTVVCVCVCGDVNKQTNRGEGGGAIQR